MDAPSQPFILLVVPLMCSASIASRTALSVCVANTVHLKAVVWVSPWFITIWLCTCEPSVLMCSVMRLRIVLIKEHVPAHLESTSEFI